MDVMAPHSLIIILALREVPYGWCAAALLEAKDDLQKMLAGLPLTDDERAAVDDGQTALDSLLAQLIDLPTPTAVPLEAHPLWSTVATAAA